MPADRKAAPTPDRAGARAAAKESKAKQKPAKGARMERLRQIRQAYTISKESDPKLPWVMLIGGVVVFAVIAVPGILFSSPWVFVPLAVIAGLMAALLIFGRRAQKAAFGQVEGQPGAAAWVLQGMRGDWRVTPSVAGTRQLDAVHRVLGRPGVMLIAEGSPQRVGGLLAQEKRTVARVVGDVPIYDIIVGDDAGQVPLKKLQSHVLKLPKNITAGQVNTLERRLAALGGMKTPIPKGPIPKGASLSVSQRTLRRR